MPLSMGANEPRVVTVVCIFLFILKAAGWDRGQGVYTGKSSSSTPNSDPFSSAAEWVLDHLKWLGRSTTQKCFHTNNVAEKRAPAEYKYRLPVASVIMGTGFDSTRFNVK